MNEQEIDERELSLLSTATYAEAYAVLSRTAARLKAGEGAADIDNLARDIRLAKTAHAVCRARIEAVRAEIEAEFQGGHADPPRP